MKIAMVESARGLQVRADALLSEVDLNDYQGIFLPGGGRGVANLRASEAVLDCVRTFYNKQKWVTAICAAPSVLAAAGILQHHKVTSFSGIEADLVPYIKTYSYERVVVDGKVITSRSAGTAEEFALVLLELLEGLTKAKEIRKAILARD
jgi:4-methyl-5(b-hydroxyethyl)-thiazole monophosphate biosynthesis